MSQRDFIGHFIIATMLTMGVIASWFNFVLSSKPILITPSPSPTQLQINNPSPTSTEVIIIDHASTYTPTPTPTSIDTPTLTPTLSPMPTFTPTVSPTDTPTPTFTPTVLLTETPLPTATATIPIANKVESSQTHPTLTPTLSVNNQIIELIFPPNNHPFPNGQKMIEFKWKWGNSCDMPAGVGFELRIWKPNSTPMGALDAVSDQNKIGCDKGVRTFTVGNFQAAPGVGGANEGQFLWDVVLVQIAPYNGQPLAKTEPVTFVLGGTGSPTGGGSGPTGPTR